MRNPLQNLVSEIIGTFVLLFALLFIVGPNDFSEGLSPLVVGLLIVAIGLSLGGTTGYEIIPARDLGPRIAHAILPIPGKGNSDWGYAWIPVIGPIIGGVYGAIFYDAVFTTNYTATFWSMSLIVGMIIVIAVLSEIKSGKNEAVETKKVL